MNHWQLDHTYLPYSNGVSCPFGARRGDGSEYLMKMVTLLD